MNLEYPLSDNYHAYTNYEIIKTKEHKTLIFGWNASENQFSGLIIHKIRTNQQFRPLSQLVRQIGPFTTYQQLQRQTCHFFKHVYTQRQKITASGIIGFHRFLQGYYLMYIKQFERVAKIGSIQFTMIGHKISEIKKTGIINLFDIHHNQTKANEQRYYQILSQYSLENYYFSCTYDLTNTLGKNMLRNSLPFFQSSEIKPQQPNPTFFSKDANVNAVSELFQFNYSVIKQFNDFVSNKKWILSIIHGFCKHLNTKVKGTIFNIIIIARRGRHHAGTRYIKRGIDSFGFVANYVEVEQIAINFSLSQDTRPVCSSFVQVRGSVPTYWMQKPSIRIPKPAIQIKNDDFMFLGTRKHFHDLIGRYGQHIYCINLMKKKQKTVRQGALSQQYQTGVSFINKQDLKKEDSIHYIEIDMKYNLKQDKKMFISKIRTLAYYTIQKTGIFLCMNSSKSNFQQSLEFQNGVIRANCVDCLDRTNSFQQLVGQIALSIQLNRLMKEHIKLQNLELDELTHSMYSKLYEEMGDLISIQYGSSLAHKQKIQQTTQKRIQFWTSIQRHWNNNLKDYDRQQQIDIFLGYKPDPQGPQIWNIKPSIDHFPDKSLQIYEKAQYKYKNYVNWFEEAILHYRKSFYLDILEAIDLNKKGTKHKIQFEEMQPIGKQLLLSKFSAESVSNLINENQSTNILMFRIKPNLKLEKRVWRAMNPKPRKMETLQQKLSYCYHKMDFLKNQQLQFQLKYSPFKNGKNQSSNSITLKSLSKLPDPNEKSGLSLFGTSNLSNKRSPKKAVSMFGLAEDDIQFKDDFKKYLTLKNNYDLDLQDQTTIQAYLNSETLKDSEIYKQIQDNFEGLSTNYYTSMGDNLYENSQEMFKTHTEIKDNGINSAQTENQLKKIEAKITSKNYIFFEEAPVLRAKADQIEISKIAQTNKKQLNKQNKILALEKTFTRNFTQGPYKMKFLEI